MPKTTKEVNEKNKNLNSKSTPSTKKTASKTVAKKTTKSTSTQKSKTKKATNKSNSAASKKATSTKKTPNKKIKNSNSVNILEYYDLPYRYNETIVKVLAQTPKTLFVYWDISDTDKNSYISQYGNDFFEKTQPVLIVNNKTMNYTFEIEINDFANCWYFDINDEKCEYSVELGRKPKILPNNNIEIPNNYLYITSSNKIESPNGHILFEKEQNIVFYKDVKSNNTFQKDVTNIKFMKYLGKANKTQEIYKKIYKNEELLHINNPSSH